MKTARQFESVLSSTTGERAVSRWLKKHPLILAKSIQDGTYVAAEFSFGTDFKADFVVLSPFSGGWDIYFVELEPPSAPLFTRQERPAKRLAGAITQVDNWKLFVEKNRPVVLRELSKHFKRHELIYENHKEPVDHAGWSLEHPQSMLACKYLIVIGRLKSLNEAEIARKAAFAGLHMITVMTYDRLIRTAKACDSGIYGPWKTGQRV